MIKPKDLIDSQLGNSGMNFSYFCPACFCCKKEITAAEEYMVISKVGNDMGSPVSINAFHEDKDANLYMHVMFCLPCWENIAGEDLSFDSVDAYEKELENHIKKT